MGMRICVPVIVHIVEWYGFMFWSFCAKNILCKLSLCRFYAGGAENEKQPALYSGFGIIGKAF